MRRCAYLEAELLTDGEPAVKALAEEVKRNMNKHGVRLTLLVAPRFSSQTLGTVGALQGICAKQLRALKSCFEKRYSLTLSLESVLWPWLVRHTGWCLNRLHIKGSGGTAFQDMTGVVYHGSLLPFGEVIMFRIAHGQTRRFKQAVLSKGELRFYRGLFVGKEE
eukprot:6468679-Amphidinium_carterae.1